MKTVALSERPRDFTCCKLLVAALFFLARDEELKEKII